MAVNRMIRTIRIPAGFISAAMLTAAALIALSLGGCASTKEIPPQVVVEPETEQAPAPTEGSLWPGETTRSSLFSDKKASRVGDLITVHLVEQTTALNRANTNKSRAQNAYLRNQLSGDTSNFIKPEIGGGQTFNGGGTTSRSEAFYGTVSATVTEVLGNGLLRIQGQRELKINDAHQYISLAGIVRPEDINYDNSILSNKIANAQIVYDGAGNLDKSQRPGGLGNIVDKYSLF